MVEAVTPPWRGEEPATDAEVQARQIEIAEVLLDVYPQAGGKLREEARSEGRLIEARSTLRRLLALRGLAVSDEGDARIEACNDLATLERWHDKSVTAKSASEALQ